MRIVPFAQVEDVFFGASQANLLSMRGEPVSRRVNRDSLAELDYGAGIYRFDASDALVEITVNVPVVDLDGHRVPYALLRSYIAGRDISMFERAGFVVSPSFGIAFDPECPFWVTAFPRESIELWRALCAPRFGA